MQMTAPGRDHLSARAVHPKMVGFLISSALLLSALTVFLAPVELHAQGKARVTIEPGQVKAIVYTTSIGVAADRWETDPYDDATLKLLQDAGVTNMRFPGNDGIDALYHWSNNAVTNPYTSDRAPAFPKEKGFAAMVPVMDALGSATVTVNYGSNLDGTGGGEPAEAAAWVAYANGNPSSTQSIGKDSKGNDWKTVGFWATLRASAPLAADDGYNQLRISHPTPLGIQLWVVGNYPWLNGYYNQAHTAGSDADTTGKYGQSPSPEPDLHDGPVPTSRDWGRRMHDEKLGPSAYGAAVVQYVKAMKAVDPTIMIGAAMAQPPISSDSNQVGKGWNAGVLKEACASMDFSAVTFWEGKGEPPHWVDNVDEKDLLLSARNPMDANASYPGQNALQYDYAQFGRDLIEKYKKFCPKGKQPPLAVTTLGLSGWLPPHNAAASALYSADSVASLIEDGAYAVEWAPIHGISPILLDTKDQPQPAYFGVKMVHEMAQVGDSFVNASSSLDTLVVHASKRRDGGLGVLLINKDVINSAVATVTVNGYNYASKGTRYDYGKETIEAGKGMVESPIEGLGGTFTVEVPRYGIVAIVIPKAQ